MNKPEMSRSRSTNWYPISRRNYFFLLLTFSKSISSLDSFLNYMQFRIMVQVSAVRTTEASKMSTSMIAKQSPSRCKYTLVSILKRRVAIGLIPLLRSLRCSLGIWISILRARQGTSIKAIPVRKKVKISAVSSPSALQVANALKLSQSLFCRFC